MAWPPGKHLESVIAQARAVFEYVRIIRYDISRVRAILDLEGQWADHRIIVSEIQRAARKPRYAYYVLDSHNQVLHAFDNSPDNLAIKQRYASDWKAHLHEEIPHQHDAVGNVTLTAECMTFEKFVEWVRSECFLPGSTGADEL
jgi:hypothetical protein